MAPRFDIECIICHWEFTLVPLCVPFSFLFLNKKKDNRLICKSRHMQTYSSVADLAFNKKNLYMSLKKRWLYTIKCKADKTQKGESIHAELLWHWLADFRPEMYNKMHTRDALQNTVFTEQTNKPPSLSKCIVVRLYHKMCFCWGIGAGSTGSDCQNHCLLEWITFEWNC